jgi:p-cumate 2,3-dioxygenase subunit alpha
MDLASLIVDSPREGRFHFHRSAMTSPEIFAAEQQRIFGRTWLYVAHDSELPNPGDYCRRTVGGRPLFIVRGADGEVREFYNTCTHRGAQVCRQESGNVQQFQCFYHAWTFNTEGELIGVPGRDGYSAAFDPARFSLRSPPRFEAYRGLYFISLDSDIENLGSYLGDAREIIDLTMDSGELLGGWRVIPGSGRFTVRANWKLLIENAIDNYHLAPVHQTYLEYMARRRAAAGVREAPRDGARAASRGLAINGRHAAMTLSAPGRTVAYPSPLWSEDACREVEQVRRRLIGRFGERRGRAMAEWSRFLVVFPSLVFQDTASGFRLRQILPLAPDLTDVVQWELVPRDERDDLRAYRAELSLTFLGPGGFATPDDVEALESCQLGYGSVEVEWSDISRGMHRLARDDDELAVRTFWRQWHAMMQGLPRAPEVEEYQSAQHGLISGM